ncbi:DUF2951 family protein [Legionella fairfieldensis]|uniref:DUF2951 family protein n=1 Tax=Legionella fairfieldensis TaxID=45064 RepID=UPI0004907106|nr:DUF2951 family protein [Legionella fairfieldensis]
MAGTIVNHSEETRFALMEQSMNHMTQSLQRLEIKIDQQFEKVDRDIKDVKQDVKEVQKELKGEIRSNFFWTLGLIGTVFAVMAHGLHWF